MIKQMDANGDGKVTKAEFDANSRAMFTRMDRNGDGVLSGNELTPPKRPGS
ncbi:EF-hand domain-containing protein [Salipiger pacificus]|uniref:EF-hand domain-containing protein n=2 Tax=Salipiger mangrovisoli TaxID=2865933 RepID=A0ABR9WZA8_9RHOB|nr:EF-hand domain-containing protein [Salipiger mangrovisoli]